MPLRRLAGLVAICLLGASPAIAAEYHVAPGGSATNAGTDAEPFATIQQGLKAAKSGDTVFVHYGTYMANCLRPEPGVSVVGLNGVDANGNPAKPRIVGETTQQGQCEAFSDAWPYPVFNIEKTSDVVVDNFMIRGGFVASVLIGYQQPASNVTVRNCDIGGAVSDDNLSGVWFHMGSGGRVERCRIHDMTGRSPGLAMGVASFGDWRSYDVIGCEIWNVDYCVRDKHGWDDANAERARRTIQWNAFHDWRLFAVTVNTSGYEILDNYFYRNSRVGGSTGAFITCDCSGRFCTPSGKPAVQRNRIEPYLGIDPVYIYNNGCFNPNGNRASALTALDSDGSNSWEGADAVKPCATGPAPTCRD